MSGLKFDKRELGNLEYSLDREVLATDRRGGYMSTTIVGCNTRKYHGLMVAPIDQSDRTYVLLSSLDETIIQHDQSFNLALHRFEGTYEPRGHKYITDFEYTPTPTITYRVGGVILKKELLWIHKRTQLMIRYTLADAHSDTTLRLRPLLAFRDKHALSKANMEADGRAYPIPFGVKCRLYQGYPWLNMQLNKEAAEFIAAPDWYYNFEYARELARGYEGHEDLLTPGYFEFNIKKGESVIFSAATDVMATPDTITEVYEASLARRTHKIDFVSCLQHSARQFVIRRPGNRTEVVAGYPWFGSIMEDTFMALPGLTLSQGHKEDCIDALDTAVADMVASGLMDGNSAPQTVDAPLWFYFTLQQLEGHITQKELWTKYGAAMKGILEAYRRGFNEEIKMHDNGLIWASAERPLTWMGTKVDGEPLTPRRGYVVEAQALWYNAVQYTLAVAKKQGDKAFVKEWQDIPERIKSSFVEKFWLDEEGYLADYVNDYETNDFRRANMLVATALDYTMLSEEQMMDVYLAGRFEVTDNTTFSKFMLNEKIRTNLPMCGGYNQTYSLMSLYRSFYGNYNMETIRFTLGSDNFIVRTIRIAEMLRGVTRVKHVQQVLDVSEIKNMSDIKDAFSGCNALVSINLKGLSVNVSMQDSLYLSQQSLLFMIQNRKLINL